MVFSMLIECATIILTPEHLHHSKMKLDPYAQSLHVLPSSQPLEATALPSVSIGFPILDISYMWNLILCSIWTGFFYLACFQSTSMYQYFIPFLWPNYIPSCG